MFNKFNFPKFAAFLTAALFSTLTLAQTNPPAPQPSSGDSTHQEILTVDKDTNKVLHHCGDTCQAVKRLEKAVATINENGNMTAEQVKELKAELEKATNDVTREFEKVAQALAQSQQVQGEILADSQSNGKEIKIVESTAESIVARQDTFEAKREFDEVSQQLRTNHYQTALYIPAARGTSSQKGQLDLVQAIASSAVNAAETKHSYNARNASKHLARANEAKEKAKFGEAVEQYGKAYRDAERGLAGRVNLWRWFTSKF